MKICTKCAGTGFYLDYAGSGLPCGIKKDCGTCEGTGWVEEKPSEDPLVKYGYFRQKPGNA